MSRQQPEITKVAPPPGRIPDDDLFEDAAGAEGRAGEGLLHLNDLIPKLLLRWHWIVLCALLGLGWGLYSVWRAVPRYQANTTVLVRDYNVTAMGQLDSAEFDLRNLQAMATVQAGMSRYEIVQHVANDPLVRELEGLEPPEKPFLPWVGSRPEVEGEPAPAPEVLAGMIAGWLSIEIRPDTRLIDISVQHPRPEVCQVVANRMVHHYIEDRTSSRSSGQQNTLEYLVAESKRVKDELQQAQTVLAAYSAPLDAEKALAAAETSVASLALRYRAKHPKMIEAQARLEQAQKSFADLLGRAVRNPFDKEYWEGHMARIGDAEEPASVDEMRDLLVSRRAVLESEVESQNSLYLSLLQQIETREVNVQQTGAEVTPHEMARLPQVPVYPQKGRMLVKATVFGIFAGFAVAFLFHFLDNKIHTIADAESQIGLSVLAAVSEVDLKRVHSDAEEADEPSPWTSARERWDPHIVFRREGAKTHYAEMFRVLRTGISLLGPTAQRKVSMVTSAVPSEGKTFVATNLAVAFAQQGLKTLLIDFDLRKPSVHRMFGRRKDERPGVVNLLTASAEISEVVCEEPGQPNLFLAMSGPKAPSPGELLEPGRIGALLEIFKENFDHIVFDTAPLLAVPDSCTLAPFANNLLLVARAEKTPKGAVTRAVDILERNGIRPSGMVLNGYLEKRYMVGRNYSYGYYRYGRSGLYHYERNAPVYGSEDEDT